MRLLRETGSRQRAIFSTLSTTIGLSTVMKPSKGKAKDKGRVDLTGGAITW
jgi:hypothetical protein